MTLAELLRLPLMAFTPRWRQLVAFLRQRFQAVVEAWVRHRHYARLRSLYRDRDLAEDELANVQAYLSWLHREIALGESDLRIILSQQRKP